MPLNARVLIVARDDSLAGELAQGLDRLGWRTVTARNVNSAVAALGDLPVEAIVIDTASFGDQARDLAFHVKASAGSRRLPLIALGQPGVIDENSPYDLTMAAPAHPAQVAVRLEALVRLATAQEELQLRVETFADRGRELASAEVSKQPWRILAIGEPAPRCLSLSNTLKQQGAQVVGAFTAYTAFDYLHEQAFEAVVLWGGENQAESLSIAAGMRRNTRLFHIPALLQLGPGGETTLSEVFHRGVSDVALYDAPELQTAQRVIELARAYRYQAAIRTALNKARSSGLMDAATGLFTRDLFAAHLVRLTDSARMRNRPLSICVLKLADKPELLPLRADGWVDRAVPQIGSMVSRLVRAEDTAARLGPDTFALALPATRDQAARVAAERIAAVIGCTAFDAGVGRAPFVVEFDIGVVEVEPNESASKALDRAAAKLRQARAS